MVAGCCQQNTLAAKSRDAINQKQTTTKNADKQTTIDGMRLNEMLKIRIKINKVQNKMEKFR